MKKVLVERKGLDKGYEAVDANGRAIPLDTELVLTEAEYSKVEKSLDGMEEAFDGKVAVTVSDAGEDDPAPESSVEQDSGESGGSAEPTPDPAGTAKSRSR
jgi:hypothetical protein